MATTNADKTRYIRGWMTDQPANDQPRHFIATRTTVYFYGPHFPLLRALDVEDGYYLNETSYSTTTTSAQKAARAALEAEGYSLASCATSPGMDECSLWMRR